MMADPVTFYNHTYNKGLYRFRSYGTQIRLSSGCLTVVFVLKVDIMGVGGWRVAVVCGFVANSQFYAVGAFLLVERSLVKLNSIRAFRTIIDWTVSEPLRQNRLINYEFFRAESPFICCQSVANSLETMERMDRMDTFHPVFVTLWT